MRLLNKWENALFLTGALLMVAGAVLSIFKWQWFAYVYAAGAIAYTSMQLLQRYEGTNVVIKRLRRIMIVSDILLLLTAVLMFASNGNSLGLDWFYYLSYVKNNWVVLLLIAAVLQLYTAYRIGNELEKEAKKL
jgi:hypothetical protein